MKISILGSIFLSGLICTQACFADETVAYSWNLGVDSEDIKQLRGAVKTLPPGTILKFRNDALAPYVYDAVCKHGTLEQPFRDYVYCVVEKKNNYEQ